MIKHLRKHLQKSCVVFAGLIAAPTVVSHAIESLPKPECKANDKRFLLLSRFLRLHKSPVVHLSSAFIQEADANHLDWRLLPGLTYVESGAGRNFRGNNIFGWNNGNSSFRTVREGIHFVAGRLAHGRSYSGKPLSEKLAVYNPNAGYRESVEAVMASISPRRER